MPEERAELAVGKVKANFSQGVSEIHVVDCA
jgi:hypothetical protein